MPAAVSAYTRGRMEEQIGRYFIPPQHVTKDLLPRLYVGAVDICEGKRRIFRDGEVDVEAIIASAAVPPLYEPVLKKTGDRESWYWDGLFATNPPVSELVRGNEDIDYADKPDVLLVIRINPTRKGTAARLGVPATVSSSKPMSNLTPKWLWLLAPQSRGSPRPHRPAPLAGAPDRPPRRRPPVRRPARRRRHDRHPAVGQGGGPSGWSWAPPISGEQRQREGHAPSNLRMGEAVCSGQSKAEIAKERRHTRKQLCRPQSLRPGG